MQRATQTKKPAKPKPADGGASALGDLSIWEQFQRIGGQITPLQASEIMRAADTGDMRRLCDFANDARQKHCHLQSVLFTRESSLANLPWELVIPGEDPRKKRQKGRRQRAFIESVLRPHPQLRDLIAHLVGSVFMGYGVAETVTKVERGMLVPDRFILQPPRRFRFRRDDSRLVWNDAKSNHQDIDFQSEWPGRFLVAQPRITGDVPCREGLVRPLMWASLFCNWTVGDWLKLAEIAWKPWRIGKFDRKATDEDRLKLEQALARLTTSGVAALSKEVDLTVLFPGQSGSGSGGKATHAELAEFLERWISKATLGQTLTTEQGKVGSQALGKVHNEVRHDIRAYDADFVASVITRFLIAPLILANFGPLAPVPQFRFITEDRADLESFSKSVKTFGEAGLRVPASWVRDQSGIPEPIEGEEVLGKETAEAKPADGDAPEEPADESEEEDDEAA